MELDRRDTELLNKHIANLEKELEKAYRMANDLDAVNKECLDEMKRLERTIDLKDQIITTYRIENAKCFHENEKLKERIEYLQKILE